MLAKPSVPGHNLPPQLSRPPLSAVAGPLFDPWALFRPPCVSLEIPPSIPALLVAHSKGQGSCSGRDGRGFSLNKLSWPTHPCSREPIAIPVHVLYVDFMKKI
jgi:hypothetical protein